jgi:hypothetical protein
LLLIQSQEYADAIESPRSKWEALAVDKFQYVLIPNSTHEEVLMQEPGVQLLAQHLTRHLTEAVSEADGRRPQFKTDDYQ